MSQVTHEQRRRSRQAGGGQRRGGEPDRDPFGLLDVQRTAGNQAAAAFVQRLQDGDAGTLVMPEETITGSSPAGGSPSTDIEMPEEHITGTPPGAGGSQAAAEPAGPNPLVGLKSGDGLAFGTFDRRPRVKLLQTKLNEKVGAGLKADGMWGPKTTAALEQFQLGESQVPAPAVDQQTGDALMGTKGKGGGEGPQPPNLANLVFNPLLEETFDQIDEEYGNLLATQGQALSAFRSDLGESPETKKMGLLGQAVMAAAEFVIDHTLGTAPESLQKVAESATKEALSAFPDTVVDQAVSQGVKNPFTAATDHGKQAVRQALNPTTTTASIPEFVDAQQRQQLVSHQQAVRSFHKAKAGMRLFTEDDQRLLSEQPIPGMVDPRVDRAAAVRDGLRKANAATFPNTYREVTSAWARVNARRGLQERGSFRQDVTEVGLLQGAGEASVAGILEVAIDFDAQRPKEPVRVTALKMAGLSPQVRARLVAGDLDPTIGELGFALRIKGSNGGADIEIAAPETHTEPEKTNKGNESADSYFLAKGDNGSGVAPEALQFRGIRLVLQEVLPQKVKAIGGIAGP